jgi:hypothetical protein
MKASIQLKKKTAGREYRVAYRQDEMISGKLSVVK